MRSGGRTDPDQFQFGRQLLRICDRALPNLANLPPPLDLMWHRPHQKRVQAARCGTNYSELLLARIGEERPSLDGPCAREPALRPEGRKMVFQPFLPRSGAKASPSWRPAQAEAAPTPNPRQLLGTHCNFETFTNASESGSQFAAMEIEEGSAKRCEPSCPFPIVSGAASCPSIRKTKSLEPRSDAPSPAHGRPGMA